MKKVKRIWWWNAWNVKTTFLVIPTIVWTRYHSSETPTDLVANSMCSLCVMWGFWAAGLFTGKTAEE